MSDIFISYAREDVARVEPLAKALELEGWSVWWDPLIIPGRSFDLIIEEALKSTRCVLVVWSNSSVVSSWVLEEAWDGVERQILLPMLIEEVRIPLGFRRIQAVNMVNWQGELPNSSFDKLKQALSVMLETSSGNPRASTLSSDNYKQQIATKQPVKPIQIKKLKALIEFAYINLDFSEEDSQKWAEAHLDQFEDNYVAILKEEYEAYYNYAYDYDELNMSSDEAKEWALAQVEGQPNRSFEKFRSLFQNLYKFASDSTGLAMYKDDAKKWALEHLEDLADINLSLLISRFAELYDFAWGADGLNMSGDEAREWALEKVLQECAASPIYQKKESRTYQPSKLKKLFDRFRSK